MPVKFEKFNNLNSTIDRPRRLLLSAIGIGAVLGLSIRNRSYGANPDENAKIIQPEKLNARAFIQRAFEMRDLALQYGDQAYGAVVVRDEKIVGQSWSRVILDQDPTGHAEMSAIRDAARRLKNRDLSGSVLYSSSRACPMCEAAAYWAGIDQMVYDTDALNAGSPKLCR